MKYLIAATAFLGLFACGDSPSAPSPTPSTTSTPAGSGVILSGTVFEVLPDGSRRPLASTGGIAVEVDETDVLDPERIRHVGVDSQGRYAAGNLPDGRFVKIARVSSMPSDSRLCATNTTMRGATRLDVLVFRRGAPLTRPVLSGQVFQTAAGGRSPVAGVDVYYASRGHGPDVWEHTDADGRYTFCGIPDMPGRLYMFCGNDAIAFEQPIEIRSDQVLDIDATSFASCLAL